MKVGGVKLTLPPKEKTTLKNPNLIRVNMENDQNISFKYDLHKRMKNYLH